MTEDIPDYLKIPQAERAAAWKGRKLTKQGHAFREPAKHEEEATRQLRREIEEAEARKKAERFEYLKSLRKSKKEE
jgi:hypothetical protein